MQLHFDFENVLVYFYIDVETIFLVNELYSNGDIRAFFRVAIIGILTLSVCTACSERSLSGPVPPERVKALGLAMFDELVRAASYNCTVELKI